MKNNIIRQQLFENIAQSYTLGFQNGWSVGWETGWRTATEFKEKNMGSLEVR